MTFTYSLFNDNFRYQLPNWPSFTSTYSIPFTSIEFDVVYPGALFNAFIYFGFATSGYFLARSLWRGLLGLRNYVKSLNNDQKYLQSSRTTSDGRTITYSAVVYGASTKAGKAYAQFLAKKGFNLILVERDIDQLN